MAGACFRSQLAQSRETLPGGLYFLRWRFNFQEGGIKVCVRRLAYRFLICSNKGILQPAQDTHIFSFDRSVAVFSIRKALRQQLNA